MSKNRGLKSGRAKSSGGKSVAKKANRARTKTVGNVTKRKQGKKKVYGAGTVINRGGRRTKKVNKKKTAVARKGGDTIAQRGLN